MSAKPTRAQRRRPRLSHRRSVLQVGFERVVQRVLPRRMMHGRHRPGHDRAIAVIAEGHDVLLLVLLPLVEGLAGALDIEAGIVRLGD